MSTARDAASGDGANTLAAICQGGATPSVTAATEEWTASLANKTITAS